MIIKCEQCSKDIEVANQKPSEYRERRFCGRSCAGKHSNTKHVNRKRGPSRVRFHKTCPTCAESFEVRKAQLSSQVFCSKICNIMSRSRYRGLIGSFTKGSVFDDAKNWQSARSLIQDDSRVAFESSGKHRVCLVCGYSKHVDVCHVKSVASFSKTATVGEINCPSNLIALCKNHHWEFDHGLMSEEDLSKLVA